MDLMQIAEVFRYIWDRSVSPFLVIFFCTLSLCFTWYVRLHPASANDLLAAYDPLPWVATGMWYITAGLFVLFLFRRLLRD